MWWGGAPRGALCLGGRVPAAGSGVSLLGGGTHAWTVESRASLPSAHWPCLWVWFLVALLPGAFGSRVSLDSLAVLPCALGVLRVQGGPSCQPPLLPPLPLRVRACVSLLGGERVTRLVYYPQSSFSELSRYAGVPAGPSCCFWSWAHVRGSQHSGLSGAGWKGRVGGAVWWRWLASGTGGGAPCEATDISAGGVCEQWSVQTAETAACEGLQEHAWEHGPGTEITQYRPSHLKGQWFLNVLVVI